MHSTHPRQSPAHPVKAGAALLLSVLLLWPDAPLLARDTDIYAIHTKQNCYVLMDSSGSMAFGVYEHSIDYGRMYDYLYTRDNIEDKVATPPNYYYKNQKDRQRIYLWAGRIGATIATVNEQEIAFPGDAGQPSYIWKDDPGNYLIDTYTELNENGELVPVEGGTALLTQDSAGNILFKDRDATFKKLPLGLDLPVHKKETMPNGAEVDRGFAGMLQAAGYYFSGYRHTSSSPHYEKITQSLVNKEYVFFFVTGNWVNMQAMYNLRYTDDAGEKLKGQAAWKHTKFPLDATIESWSEQKHNLDYPEGDGNYANNLTDTRTITFPDAIKIEVHFSKFDVAPGDRLEIRDGEDILVSSHDNNNAPTWSQEIEGNTVKLTLITDGSTTGKGYTIDKVKVLRATTDSGEGTYQMQSRLDVAKEAVKYTVNAFRGKMNWGLAAFAPLRWYYGWDNDGAVIKHALDPDESDATNRQNILDKLDTIVADGGTPLMEALQDVWTEGYYKKRQVLNKVPCRKNYIISMTDGYPSVDNDASRIYRNAKGLANPPNLSCASLGSFCDADGDGWTSDPYQRPVEDNYYDDVAHWIYSHKWEDGSLIPKEERAKSFENVITHHIAFGARHPLLEDAAKDSGGEYLEAYNKEQLVAAFHSLGLLMAEAISFTAPVVSVDAVNKIQHGNDLYMGQFLPMDVGPWVGNLKKFHMGDGSAERPDIFKLYDKNNNLVIGSDGRFLDNYGAADIQKGGAGEVLLKDVQALFAAKAYWDRPIYTWKGGQRVEFNREKITAADLNVEDDAARDKLINFVHGYTQDADPGTGDPVAVRDWVLGPIIHSRPVVIDYFDTEDDDTLPLQKRLVVVGSNDGMLHVFDDTDGREVFAFIPPDLLPKLHHTASKQVHDTVDGPITLFRKDKKPKYLLFGERRGGNRIWCLNIADQDPLQWTVQWQFTHPQMVQSWSEIKTAKVPTGTMDEGGKRTYRDVAIFTAGYDPQEDNYPEPFLDLNGDGNPFTFKDDGTVDIDDEEWWSIEEDKKNGIEEDRTYDPNKNGEYDVYNPYPNQYGRGIFVVDIDDPAETVPLATDASTTILPFFVTGADFEATGEPKPILPFSVTYGNGTTKEATGAAQTLSTMQYCFPASPAVVTGTDRYRGAGATLNFEDNVLRTIYAVDIYANLFRVNLQLTEPTDKDGTWQIDSANWKVEKIFSANPSGKESLTIQERKAFYTDRGRKAFYPPAISWGGSKGYFEAQNYFFPDTELQGEFQGTSSIASLFFGTGDLEHPRYSMVRNRFYAIYDDSSVIAYQDDDPVVVSSYPYDERNLLNLTCNELGQDTKIKSCYLDSVKDQCTAAPNPNSFMKEHLRTLLKDDAVYGSPAALEQGALHEDDAKGWYIVLPDQGKDSVCGHTENPSTLKQDEISSRDNHDGEQVLSQATLFHGILYFTTYQGMSQDPCNPQNNGFSYALNYLDASPAYDLNAADGATINMDITDRYKKFTGISGIPSGFAIILRDGRAAAMASMGGKLIGPSDKWYEIKHPGLGLELYYWRDSNSQE
ncbi:MAG: hypothetical protein ACOX5Z_12440 [Desulfobulbus sp.]|jgi:type IV pilus assembly protein PilY1